MCDKNACKGKHEAVQSVTITNFHPILICSAKFESLSWILGRRGSEGPLFLRRKQHRVIEPRRTKQPWDFRHRGARPLNTWRNRTNRIGRGARRSGVGAHTRARTRIRAIFMARATRGWKRMPSILGCFPDNRPFVASSPQRARAFLHLDYPRSRSSKFSKGNFVSIFKDSTMGWK